MAGAREGAGAVPIGRPARGTEYVILDRDRRPVATGEVGELCIGGIQLARGYLHRPDLTAERFFHSPYAARGRGGWLYRSGDLAYWNADGTVQCVGRADSQVKLRGYRVELDEIRLRIEAHDWVRNGAVIVTDDPATGFQSLVSFVELDPKEAAVMDQGNHGAHHQSKASKLQVKAQLSNPGCRDADELRGRPVIELPGRQPSAQQRELVFGRKTYRSFEGGALTRSDILRLLGRRVSGTAPRDPCDLSFAEWGTILRYFGQYHSPERLLPKYGYASPGSLYATQMYVETGGIAGLRPGIYYYHPAHHRLVLIKERPASEPGRFVLHFVGRRSAIEPVYRNNIQEVLEIETGHMVGLFEEILPAYGLDIAAAGHEPVVKGQVECADEDYYLGTFEIIRSPGAERPDGDAGLDIYVQAHPGRVADLAEGQYLYRDGELERLSDERVLKKHVIAINQQVYDRASLGITVVSRSGAEWMRYVALGRKLQRLQMNDQNIGFMSSGYSSKTGNDLPSAKRMARILADTGRAGGPSYFFVGGLVTDEQRRSEGMKEDLVHMKGPAEMIRDDLVAFLPDYMVPNRVTVLDRLPLTANGKVDVKALAALDTGQGARSADRPFTAPRTRAEKRITAIWTKLLKREAVSVLDDFFESGGNSLIAVSLVNRINKEFGSTLPLQVLFASPTVERLALALDPEPDGTTGPAPSRLVPLRACAGIPAERPVFCWPGLGGYAMNLRPLAGELTGDRPFYGVQARGINQGETPYPTVQEMAAEDVEAIREIQPEGPYTLWGYSFGARVAFETAYQLERSGHQVDQLFLIAPGSPRVRPRGPAGSGPEGVPGFHDEAFITILFSVFAGTITGPVLDECLRVTRDEESFTAFISDRYPQLGPELVTRVIRIVRLTFGFSYSFDELLERRISAPVTIFKARGDDYSFIEGSSGYSAATPVVVQLDADHYTVLRETGVGELAAAVKRLNTR
jgi:thioesterase domain-containing protein/acyl carrier protein